MYFILLFGGKNQYPYKHLYGIPYYKYVLESLSQPKKFIVIVNEETKFLPFSLMKEFPDHHWDYVLLPFNTRGAAESVYQGLNARVDDLDEPFWVLDNDVIYDIDTEWDCLQDHITIMTKPFISSQDKTDYCHVITQNDMVINLVEKQNKSDRIMMGGYGFPSFKVFKKLYHMMLSSFNNQDYFLSEVIRFALRRSLLVIYKDKPLSFTIGSREQIEDAIIQGKLFPKPLRWVFDLDDTIVSQPTIQKDYTSVLAIPSIVDFIRYLYNHKHYIIIYTARHMKTCQGDVNKIIDKVGEITKDSLKNLNIPYHELIFGKPYADIYVDDKAISPFHFIDIPSYHSYPSYHYGLDRLYLESMKHKKVIKITENLCYKYDKPEILAGYIYYVKNAPNSIKLYLPELIKVETQRVLMEWIDGVTIGQLYTNESLAKRIFKQVLDMLSVLHSQITDEPFLNKTLVMENYHVKLEQRVQQHSNIYNLLTDMKPSKILENIKIFFEYYEPRIVNCIHGDFWFSNLIWHHYSQKLYMIDMRGKLGDTLSLGGDAMYDYAKLYQSIVGFDYLIQKGMLPKDYYREPFEKMFIDYLNKEKVSFRDVQKITFVLIYGSLPFHREIYDNPTSLKLYETLLESLW